MKLKVTFALGLFVLGALILAAGSRSSTSRPPPTDELQCPGFFVREFAH